MLLQNFTSAVCQKQTLLKQYELISGEQVTVCKVMCLLQKVPLMLALS